MTRNQDIGKKSEDYVADYLVSHGATILSRNFSVHNVGELDIICAYKGKVLIIEVKSRDRNLRYGTPEEAVTSQKQRKIFQTTACFCRENHISLDIVSYYVAAVIHDAQGNVLDVKFTPFF